MRIRRCLDAVKNADRLVEVLRLADELAVEAGRDGGSRNIRVLLSAIGSADQISAIAAIHALAQVSDEEADSALSELLSSERGFVREHSAWALSARAPRPKPIGRLIAKVAQLALADFADSSAPNYERANSISREGITVAQLFLHADIDPELRHAGSGDNGGIATLLVRLGDALVSMSKQTVTDTSTGLNTRLPINRVLTLSRGTVDEALQSLATLGEDRSGHLYGRIPLLQEPVQSAHAWPMRVATRRGISRIIRAGAPVDVIHLRMADVGTLAAFDTARAFDIPVIFTAAPDPHGLINSMDLSGQLSRENFGTIDEVEHFWFRARLVQRLAFNSAHTVFFPRPSLRQDMRDLMGIDIEKEPGRYTTVPEGIDLAVTDQAVREAQSFAAGGPPSAPLADLQTLLEELPVERRGLPLLVSVGRFHRVKGMTAIVETWAGSGLRDRANVLLVGGNLQNPSADEREQFDRIDQIIDPLNRIKEGLVLLEAMASGLPVVGPDSGGPATYVEQGRTGFLTTTWDPRLLSEAIEHALVCAASEVTDERAAYSRSVVQERFTVESMAHALIKVYSEVHHDDVQHRKELVFF